MVGDRTLRRYYNDGKWYTVLAGGGEIQIQSHIFSAEESIGSIFLLLIAAAAKQKSRVREFDVQIDTLIRLNHILRAPPGK
jgi:hypothetical protein